MTGHAQDPLETTASPASTHIIIHPLQNAVTEHYLPNMCPHPFFVGPQRIEKFHVKSLKHFLGARDPTQGLEDQRIFSCYLKQKRN